MTNETSVLACHDLRKVYSEGPQQVEVLSAINLNVARGEKLAIIGSSGAGKSTLLNMLGGLDLPTEGKVIVNGQDITTLNETQRGYLRNRELGFVYQFHHLLGEFTALENVAMPLLIGNMATAQAQQKAKAMLAKVGLVERIDHKPSELSGGERQRVAIARALVTEPACVLLDEPTGNLDQDTAATIHALMQELNASLQTSFVIVTHDRGLAAQMDRVLELNHGVLNEVSL